VAKPSDYWRLNSELTVREAALLILNKEPGDHSGYGAKGLPSEYTAISKAILSGLRETHYSAADLIGEVVFDQDGNPSDYCSIVLVESLVSWLESKHVKSGFFFPDLVDGEPDYLNPNHPNYSAKLAAAVNVWIAVTSDKRYADNGKSPKANIENWLTASAERFGLVSEDGEINNTAIKEQISKVVNLRVKGGSPATPTSEPTPTGVEPDPIDFDDDSDIPF
jgi:hypothetical protein